MRPTRTSTLVLFVAGVILFVLSASGQPDTFWASGPSWLGWTGFIGVSICMLAADRLGALRARRRRSGTGPGPRHSRAGSTPIRPRNPRGLTHATSDRQGSLRQAFLLALLAPVASVVGRLRHLRPSRPVDPGRPRQGPGGRRDRRRARDLPRQPRDQALSAPDRSPRGHRAGYQAGAQPLRTPDARTAMGICVHGAVQLPMGRSKSSISNVSIEGFTVRNFAGAGIIAVGRKRPSRSSVT